jgi:ribosomal protein S18 acetylase RimI-like enzyme
MSETISLRPARPRDASGIARVHVETWRDTYAGLVPEDYLLGMTEAGQTARWTTALRGARPAETALVAEVTGPGGPQIVGFGSCGRARAGPAVGEVFTLYVCGEWQNGGIGRRLLVGLFEVLADRKTSAAVIWVLSGNPARFFYEAMGGVRKAERKERFAGATLDETAYVWPDLRAWLNERGARLQ